MKSLAFTATRVFACATVFCLFLGAPCCLGQQDLAGTPGTAATSDEPTPSAGTEGIVEESASDGLRINRALANSSWREAIDLIVSLLRRAPDRSADVVEAANHAFAGNLNEVAQKEVGFLTTEEDCKDLDKEMGELTKDLKTSELRELARTQAGFRRLDYLDRIAQVRAEVYSRVRLSLLDTSGAPTDAKRNDVVTMFESLVGRDSVYTGEDHLSPGAAVLHAEAALLATPWLDKKQDALAVLQKARMLNPTPEVLDQIADLERKLRSLSTSAPTTIVAQPPANAWEKALRYWQDYGQPWADWGWNLLQENLRLVIGVVVALGLLWLLPLLVINHKTAHGDIVASMYKANVTWFGILGYLYYLFSRPREGRQKEEQQKEGQQKEGAEKEKSEKGKPWWTGLTRIFRWSKQEAGDEHSNISCSFCKKPIDRIKDYESQKFDECPHCHGKIEPLFELESYLKYLVTQVEESVGKRRRRRPVDAANSEAMSKLLQGTYNTAVRRRATDIHIRRDDNGASVRLRVDGVLADAMEVPPSIATNFLSAIKVHARGIDPTNHTTPQDGRDHIDAEGTHLDVRIACNPNPRQQGETIAMRLLDKRRIMLGLADLGFEGANLKNFEEVLHKPHGLILVTGRTGSGKSTTLYVALQQINTGERNIVTIEDPVEYELQGLNQMEINERKGFTFATALRSVLRMDPDVIVVGESRDAETAAMAVDAAVTGHLVFTTLHNEDTAAAISRLADLGVSGKRYASALELIVAQRLVRIICAQCKEPYQPEDAKLEMLGITRYKSVIKFMTGKGCPACNYTGYYGRKAILEILKPDDEMRELMERETSPQVLRDRARRKGMKLLREEAIMKIVAGQTTVDEVLRTTDD